MAMTADSSTNNNHSPRSPPKTSCAAGVNTNTSSAASVHLKPSFPSPWAQVVRGEPETISTTLLSSSPSTSSPPPPLPPISAPGQDFSDCSTFRDEVLSPPDNSSPVKSDGSNGNVGLPNKPAWKPLNGVVEPVGPVMGASWPALSESTRPSPKSSSDSSKPPPFPSDGSPVPTPQGPKISEDIPQKQPKSKTNPNPKFTPPVRPRVKRGGAGGGPAQIGFNRPPPPPSLPPPFPVFEIPYGNLVPAVLDSPAREPSYKGNNWEARPMGGVGAQSHAVNDHSSQRNSSRKGNFGPRPRGVGVYHNGYGGRHDQDRNWNSSWSSTARGVHLPHTMGPPPSRGFIRPPSPPPGSTPFMVPPHLRPFGRPMGFDMASPILYVPALPSESFRAVPLVSHPPPPPMFFMDPPLSTLLVNQIDYYFSDANLVEDEFLKTNMDVQGWVPISLIASFRRVEKLTNNIQFILDSLRASKVVEVQGDKVRRRNDWKKWLPSSSRPDLGSQINMLAPSLQKVEVEDVTAGSVDAQKEVVPSGLSSESLEEDTAEKAP